MTRGDLTRLTGNGNGNGQCGGDDCPNVYRTGSGSIVVQGNLSRAFDPPEGEALVEIPEAVLREAVHALGW
ncbi:hypothetical protein AB0L75_27425 [Streptomyces sp. NPDC052101]|uniref:hypothetical protein n=1 Tax=Streptomyces sp. NPDC052101 TaxID=3155763 RepID=UPI003438DFD5